MATIKVANLGIETDKAIQVFTADGREVWLPFSAVQRINRTFPPTIVIEDWLAEKEDL